LNLLKEHRARSQAPEPFVSSGKGTALPGVMAKTKLGQSSARSSGVRVLDLSLVFML
jgi:hypothetical protein